MKACSQDRARRRADIRDRIIAAGLAIVTAAATIANAQAGDWPTRAVTVVVPLGPGSALETIGRPVLEQLGQRLGQAFVIENRAGAGTSTGTAFVARAAPDGYTVLFQSSTLSILQTAQQHKTYDAFADFIAVVPLGKQPTLLVASTSKGFKTVADLVAAAKANPGAMNFASAGPGSTSHIAAERFVQAAGIKAQHVPFRAPSEGLTETMTGRIDFYFPPISVGLPMVRDGKMVALAVSTRERSTALPDVPTTTELGLVNSAFEFWTGFFLPARTPQDIVDRLNAETLAVLATPAIQAQLRQFGYQGMKMSPAQFATFFRGDVDDLAVVIRSAGISINP